MEWFKQAKESQGSVSARSFLEAKQANSNGKYIIGNLSEDPEHFLEHTAKLQDVVRLKIRLEIKNKDGKVQEKELSLENVHDLQSRLMLLGRENNKSEDNINEGIFEKEYFVKVVIKVIKIAFFFYENISPYCLTIIIFNGNVQVINLLIFSKLKLLQDWLKLTPN